MGCSSSRSRCSADTARRMLGRGFCARFVDEQRPEPASDERRQRPFDAGRLGKREGGAGLAGRMTRHGSAVGALMAVLLALAVLPPLADGNSPVGRPTRAKTRAPQTSCVTVCRLRGGGGGRLVEGCEWPACRICGARPARYGTVVSASSGEKGGGGKGADDETGGRDIAVVGNGTGDSALDLGDAGASGCRWDLLVCAPCVRLAQNGALAGTSNSTQLSRALPPAHRWLSVSRATYARMRAGANRRGGVQCCSYGCVAPGVPYLAAAACQSSERRLIRAGF